MVQLFVGGWEHHWNICSTLHWPVYVDGGQFLDLREWNPKPCSPVDWNGFFKNNDQSIKDLCSFMECTQNISTQLQKMLQLHIVLTLQFLISLNLNLYFIRCNKSNCVPGIISSADIVYAMAASPCWASGVVSVQGRLLSLIILVPI